MTIRARYSLVACGVVAGVVWVNALWLQEGRHPAPLFGAAPQVSAAAPSTAEGPGAVRLETEAAVPQQAIFVTPPAPPSKPLEGERLALLQRALFEMGFYDGPVDGIDGPRTHFAVLSYRKAHGLEAIPVADEALLAHAGRANGEGLAVARPEPLSAGQRRVRAVQMVLEKLGYMNGGASGSMDGRTRDAIARFQRDHGLPVTGEVTGPLVRELSAASGVPLDERAG